MTIFFHNCFITSIKIRLTTEFIRQKCVLCFIVTYSVNSFLSDKYEQCYAVVNVDIRKEPIKVMLLSNDAMRRVILEKLVVLG